MLCTVALINNNDEIIILIGKENKGDKEEGGRGERENMHTCTIVRLLLFIFIIDSIKLYMQKIK